MASRKSPAEGLWRQISVRIWTDDKFRQLSQAAQILWFYLLTGPHTTGLPGLYATGKARLAEELHWTEETLLSSFNEIAALGMANADWDARVVWLPR
jgi:hypothetical protein